MLFAVLLRIAVSVAQPVYDLGEHMFQDGTVAFTAVIKNATGKPQRVCTDGLESFRVKSLTVDGERVTPRAPDQELELPTAAGARDTLGAGQTADVKIAALLGPTQKGARTIYQPAGRGLYKVIFEYRCGTAAPVATNAVTFRVH